jgi:hypothetical protein
MAVHALESALFCLRSAKVVRVCRSPRVIVREKVRARQTSMQNMQIQSVHVPKVNNFDLFQPSNMILEIPSKAQDLC